MLRGKERPKPGPTYMSEEQKAEYLYGLRHDKLSRPSGSRPAPPARVPNLRRNETEANLITRPADDRPPLPTSNSMPVMQHQQFSHRRNDSNFSAKVHFAGRPLVRPPTAASSGSESDTQMEPIGVQRRPSIPYMERGTRWMERQETRSLRMALEDMDMEQEKKVHAAAQDEAAELVWKHRNPEAAQAKADAPYPNPDVRRDYRSHMRKGSYQRSHSQELVPVAAQRSASGGSQGEPANISITSNKRKSMEVLRKISPPSGDIKMTKRRTPSGKSYGGLAEAVADDIAKAHRRTSSGGSSKRILSGEKKMFMHPNDRIWEDPREEPPAQMPVAIPPTIPNVPTHPAHFRKNPFARVRMQAEKLERSNSEPIISPSTPMMHHNVEIQRNPPSQSKKPWYMSNEPLPPTPPSSGGLPADEVSPKVTPTKDGKELRGDDIRAATSKSRKDYSPKLPRPTVVSDKPGRPIVSFKEDWKPKEVVLRGVQAPPAGKPDTEPSKRHDAANQSQVPLSSHSRAQGFDIPQICVDEAPRPPIPTINVPDRPVIPSIVLPDEPGFAEPADIQSAPVTPSISVDPPSINIQAPSINVSGPVSSSRSPRAAARPLPHHSATSPLPKSTPHFTPSVRQSRTLCAHCALPIAGRILSAAGKRFHPSCFVCHQCHTNLELVAFYPEPEKQRTERLERITARQSGDHVPGTENMSEDEFLRLEYDDGDGTLRFYCHLDFHELFSPRCKSCKTPIEGEVIVACGAEWHVGHFFCAQCGDPFDSSTPFVEKDGYAWCVGCHTNRYSSKCRKCKKPVTETVLKAQGYDWHAECFVCVECNGEFEDGRYFIQGESQDPVCVKCEERRLKA